MSTRSLIAIPIDDGNAAIGVYHHFDGYPTGVGVALIRAYAAHKTYARLVKRLIIDHGGWSSIVNADWDLEPGFVDLHNPNRPCGDCDDPMWRHYRQYYESRGANPPKPFQVEQFDHKYKYTDVDGDNRPMCYCHGARTETNSGFLCITEQGTDVCQGTDCDPLFLEWAYRLYPQGVEVWEAREIEGGGSYRHYRVGRVSWDAVAPSKATAAIEEGRANPASQWGDQMATLVQAFGSDQADAS